MYMYVEEVEAATDGLNSDSVTCSEEQDFNLKNVGKEMARRLLYIFSKELDTSSTA